MHIWAIAFTREFSNRSNTTLVSTSSNEREAKPPQTNPREDEILVRRQQQADQQIYRSPGGLMRFGLL